MSKTETEVKASDILAELDFAVKCTRSASTVAPEYDRIYLRGASDALHGFRRLVRSEEFSAQVAKSRVTGVPHER